MSALTIGLGIALMAVLAAEFVNGWTDAPNAIATVISTGVMTPRRAVVMAVVMNTVGAMAGTAVATTVAQGIVAPSTLKTTASICNSSSPSLSAFQPRPPSEEQCTPEPSVPRQRWDGRIGSTARADGFEMG